MTAELKIPADKIEEVREHCRRIGVKLLFDPDDNSWVFSGNKLPSEFEKFASKVKTWVLDVPYEERSTGLGLGAKWKAENKVWTYEGSSLPPELQQYLPLAHSWEEYQAEKLNGQKRKTIQAGTLQLHKHQIAGKNAIVEAYKAKLPGFLLADEVGLGKTYTAWSALYDCLPDKACILIVAPLAVLPVWREAIAKIGSKNYTVIIINYDRLKKLFDTDRKVKSLKGLARHGSSMHFDAVIWDESHYLKSMASDSPAARAKLAENVYKASKFQLWLSATAGQNILELGYLKPVLTKIGGKFTSLEQWCQAQGFDIKRGDYGKWIWEPTAQEEAKLHACLFKNKPIVGLRRQPKEVAGWPEIKRILQPIEMTNAERKLYNLAWAEFIQALELDRSAGRISTNGLTATLRLRQKASLLKVEYTCELADELVRSGKRVPISVEFLDSVKAIEEGLKKRHISFVSITGETKDKEANRLAFQNGKYDVVLFTVREGISLHEGQLLGDKDKARVQIVHDLRWSGITQHQIDGRSHRDGKYCPIYWMVLTNTVEEHVAQKLLARMDGMAGILGDTKELLLELMNMLGTNKKIQ